MLQAAMLMKLAVKTLLMLLLLEILDGVDERTSGIAQLHRVLNIGRQALVVVGVQVVAGKSVGGRATGNASESLERVRRGRGLDHFDAWIGEVGERMLMSQCGFFFFVCYKKFRFAVALKCCLRFQEFECGQFSNFKIT